MSDLSFYLNFQYTIFNILKGKWIDEGEHILISSQVKLDYAENRDVIVETTI